MGDSVLSVGISGLFAAQAGLNTTGHNIANVNTPGFSRQQVVQATRPPLFTGGGFVGQGVDVTTIRRIYSDFLGVRMVQSQASASELSTLTNQLSQLDSLFGDTKTGLAPAISEFFSAVNALTASPADAPSRRATLTAASSLVARFGQVAGELDRLRSAANGQISSMVGDINTYAKGIATLNKRIMEAGAATPSQLPNDLLDQRDALVASLNERVGANFTQQSDGTYNVFLSSGQALVVGQQIYTMVAIPDTSDPAEVQVGLQTGAGVLRFRADDFSGGSLSGVLQFRDHDLTAAQNNLGRVAITLGQAVNAQNRLGQDLNGNLGGDVFSVPGPTVKAAATNGSAAVIGATVSNASALTASDYRVDYDGTNYNVVRLDDGSTRSFLTLPQTVDGLAFSLVSGVPVTGDSYLVQPTRHAASDLRMAMQDPAKIAAASPIRTAVGTTNTGTGTVTAGNITAAYLAAPLAAPVTITYNAATNQLTGFGPPIAYADGVSATVNGVTLTFRGALGDGDSFKVMPNVGGTNDNRNAQAMAALAGQNLVAGGTTTFEGAYADLVNLVGTRTKETDTESEAQSNLLKQAQAAQSSVSGVNLDEEAANLQRYQQAYQASGKLIAIASSLFELLLTLGAR